MTRTCDQIISYRHRSGPQPATLAGNRAYRNSINAELQTSNWCVTHSDDQTTPGKIMPVQHSGLTSNGEEGTHQTPLIHFPSNTSLPIGTHLPWQAWVLNCLHTGVGCLIHPCTSGVYPPVRCVGVAPRSEHYASLPGASTTQWSLWSVWATWANPEVADWRTVCLNNRSLLLSPQASDESLLVISPYGPSRAWDIIQRVSEVCSLDHAGFWLFKSAIKSRGRISKCLSCCDDLDQQDSMHARRNMAVWTGWKFA